MGKSIKDIVPQLIKDVNFKRERIFPSVDVTVAVDELAKLPEECIQSFRFKVSSQVMELKDLISGPLVATIDADSISSRQYLNYLFEVGFESYDKETGEVEK